jgi:hypothetical protein
LSGAFWPFPVRAINGPLEIQQHKVRNKENVQNELIGGAGAVFDLRPYRLLIQCARPLAPVAQPTSATASGPSQNARKVGGEQG